MKTTRVLLVAGSSAALIAAGYAASPKALPSFEVVQPGTPPVDDGAVQPPANPSEPSSAPPREPSGDGYTDGVFDGPRVTNLRGGYQAQVTIDGGVIVSVAALEAGTSAPESVRVNAFAVPALAERVLEAQSADVEHISGSSFTSPAMIESIEGALQQALA
ncbi:MAG: hypothetical protein CVT64_11665 [Actinobacteria bacterium HGW-Actinobacteria-4]|nr:MAG: hypothetical protein CVT64_11665 [Actinobacteria bacterium HGW-Actinobacteria-4]